MLAGQPLVYAHSFPEKWGALVSCAPHFRATDLLLLNSMPTK